MTFFNVERASMEDLTAIWEIDEAVNPSVRRRPLLLEAVKDRHCLVAKTGWNVRGFAVRNPQFFGYWQVSIMVVATGYRRQGAGRRLMAYAEATAGQDRIFASVDEANTDCRAFYEAVGYKQCGAVSGVSETGHEQLIYIKHLRRWDAPDNSTGSN